MWICAFARRIACDACVAWDSVGGWGIASEDDFKSAAAGTDADAGADARETEDEEDIEETDAETEDCKAVKNLLGLCESSLRRMPSRCVSMWVGREGLCVPPMTGRRRSQ